MTGDPRAGGRELGGVDPGSRGDRQRQQHTGDRGVQPRLVHAPPEQATENQISLQATDARAVERQQRGQHVMLYGPAELRGTAGMQLTNPQYEILNEEGDGEGETIHTGRIVPVYEKAGSVTSKMQRKIVHDALDRLPRDLADSLPERLLTERRWPSRYAALLALHFPPSDVPIDALNRFETPAQQRLIYEEAFAFQLGLLARRRFASLDRKASTTIVDDRIRASARAVLPFRLTNGQRQALKEIVEDLQRPQPMNRLLQGDVGAGKTIVALLAALVAMAGLWHVGTWFSRTAASRPASHRAAVPTAALSSRQVSNAIGILLALIFSKFVYLACLGSYYTFYLISRFHLSVQSAQLHLFLFLGAVAAGTFAGGPLGDRIGRRSVLLGGSGRKSFSAKCSLSIELRFAEILTTLH